MTYLWYHTILSVYIVLGTFPVKLQSEKTNAYEKRILRLLLQAMLKQFKTVSRKLVLGLKL